MVVFAGALGGGYGVVAVVELDWFQSSLDVSILRFPLGLTIKLGRQHLYHISQLLQLILMLHLRLLHGLLALVSLHRHLHYLVFQLLY